MSVVDGSRGRTRVEVERRSAGLDGRESIVGVGVGDSSEGGSAEGLGEGGEGLGRLGGHGGRRAR